MLEAMGSFGSGILSNLLSDSLGKKFELFKDKKATTDFIQNLREWEIEFEKQNDGTVITNSEFFSYVKNFNAIENIVDYVLEPNGNSVTEDVFLNSLKEEMVRRIEEVTKKKLSLTDKDLIRDFLAYLFAATKKAMYQYLSFYGVTLDSVIFPLSELRNPLFLRLFCIANKNAHISLGETSLPSIYSKYIDVIEQKVSERCNYNKSYRLVSKIIDKMVSKRFDEHNGAIMLSLDETLSEIVDICKKWNVTADVYGALLAEGVLAQGYTYDNVEYVYITYERLEDFYLAQKIASEYSQLSRERFIEKYSWILRRPDILQYFGIILSEDYGRELRDAFFCEKEENTYFMTEAFAYV